MDTPTDLKYTDNDEWIRVDDSVGTIGITDGMIKSLNEDLTDSPELINADPFGDAWLIQIEMTDPSELDELLDADKYTSLERDH